MWRAEDAPPRTSTPIVFVLIVVIASGFPLLHAGIHVPVHAIIFHEIVLLKSSAYDRAILLLADFVVDLGVFLLLDGHACMSSCMQACDAVDAP